MAKTYVSFNKTGYYHVIDGNFKFSVVNPIQGAVLKLYALDSDESVDKLTWNNAYGNDTSTVGIKLSNVYGGTEIAAITLTDATEYTVNVKEALVALEKNENVVFALTAENGVKKQVVKDFNLEIASAVYNETDAKPVINEVGGILSVDSPYRIDYLIEKVEIFVDGKEAAGEVVINGQVTNVKPVVTAGSHTAYAVITYADGKTIQSNTVTFNMGSASDILYGDVDNSGAIDTSDLASLKLYLAGIGEVGENADCDANGSVDTGDLASLKLFLAGAVTELGPK